MQTCKPFGRLLAHSLPGNQSLGFLKETCSREGGDAAQPAVGERGGDSGLSVCPLGFPSHREAGAVKGALCILLFALGREGWSACPIFVTGWWWCAEPQAQGYLSTGVSLKLCDLRRVINLFVF